MSEFKLNLISYVFFLIIEETFGVFKNDEFIFLDGFYLYNDKHFLVTVIFQQPVYSVLFYFLHFIRGLFLKQDFLKRSIRSDFTHLCIYY